MNALSLAVEKLRKSTLEEIVKKSGVRVDRERNVLLVPYLNKTYFLNLEDFTFQDETSLSTKEKILILRYLSNCNDVLETGNLISFSELEAGNIYKPSIEARIYQPIISRFGSDVGDFLRKTALLGAQHAGIGEFSVKLKVFPKVFIYIIVYPADEEFPASCQILFDSSIKQIFDTEDIVVMCEEITEKIVC
ncbi:MAG: DUF3786 domain-containing protein [Candidatus Omnitrophica bacterium]|nr:DUF3786 domain-containing protein [Candidatus Omnitrophota bacterium]